MSNESYRSCIQNPKSTYNQSSMYCTSLHFSSSTSSETNHYLGNQPFLPNPPNYDRCIPAVNSPESSLLSGGGVNSRCGKENSSDLMKGFFNIPGQSSEGIFWGENYGRDNLTVSQQLELQNFSEELNIAINDTSDNPRLDVSTTLLNIHIYFIVYTYEVLKIHYLLITQSTNQESSGLIFQSNEGKL